MSHCPGCGSTLRTELDGVHVFGCGFQGDYGEDHDGLCEGRSNRWSRSDQIEILEKALTREGIDPGKAGDLLKSLRELLWGKSKHVPKPHPPKPPA